MIIIDTTTLLLALALVALAVAGCVVNPFFLIPLKKRMAGEEDFDQAAGIDTGNLTAMPPLSVIVSTGDNVAALEENLPVLLSQDYPAGYQVIIVANEGDSNADDLTKRFSSHRHLKSTFIPESSRYVSREKLGITLGIKAADNEWCLLMDAACRPISTNWLREIGQQCTSHNNLVVGYCNYTGSSSRLYRFNRLRHFANLWRESSGGIAFASNLSNLALRKSEFIKGDGFRGNLDIVRGEYDFIVNKYARKGCTAFVTSEEGMLIENAPLPRQHRRQQLYYIHSCRHMKRSFRHSLMPVADHLLLHLTLLLSVAAVAWSVADIETRWPLLAAAVAALAVQAAGRTLSGRRATRYFNAAIKTYQILPLELSILWHTLRVRLAYCLAPKRDFTCHKI